MATIREPRITSAEKAARAAPHASDEGRVAGSKMLLVIMLYMNEALVPISRHQIAGIETVPAILERAAANAVRLSRWSKTATTG